MITVYFTESALRFVTAPYQAAEGEHILSEEELTRAKIVKFFESCNTIVVPCNDVEAAFEHFAQQFKRVDAAGGVVEDEQHRVLMIYRRQRWDLPKGRIDDGEECMAAALREVEEETGIKGVKIVAPLCNTLHAYNVYGEWELKRTYWFAMECNSQQTLPQTDEDIECAVWCDAMQVAENLNNTYPTIKEVIAYGKDTLG